MKQQRGFWVQMSSLDIVHVFCLSDIDWICLDYEHGIFSDEFLSHSVKLIKANKKQAFIRFNVTHTSSTSKFLDMGFDGVFLAGIKDLDQIKQVHSLMVYPPSGSRGIGFCQNNLYGKNLKETISSDNPVLIPIIETREICSLLDELCDLPFIDSAFIGPYDLSYSVGINGDFESVEFCSLLTLIESKVSNKLALGIHVLSDYKTTMRDLGNRGYRFFALGTDGQFIVDSVARVGL